MIDEVRNADDIHVFEGNRIKLDELIKENLLLGIPMKALCSEGCRGICAACGLNLNRGRCDCKTENIDPRLEKLKDYFKGQNA